MYRWRVSGSSILPRVNSETGSNEAQALTAEGLGLHPAPPPFRYVTLHKFLNPFLVGLSFLIYKNGDNKSTYLKKLFKGLKELIHIKRSRTLKALASLIILMARAY